MQRQKFNTTIQKCPEDKCMNNLIITILRFINKLIPKNDNQIIFASYPNLSDNPRALYEYLIKEFKGKKKSLWVVSKDKKGYYSKKSDFEVITTDNIKGLYQLFRSKFIFTSNNSYVTICSSNQIKINLWHGMPLKGMGFLDNSENNKKELEYLRKVWTMNDVIISTSPLMRNVISACFTVNPRKIYITGQPRNDKLFSENGRINLSKILKTDLSQINKIIFYCPTYRKGGKRIDGKTKKQEIFEFEDYNEINFNQFLKKNNILFIMKFHPFEEKYYLSKFKSHENIKLLTADLLSKNFLDLYDLLNSMDILITDYSSVYFDFLLLDRPIIFTPTDINEYCDRGFTLEPYEFWAPGPKVFSLNKLIEELQLFNDDPNYYKTERKTVNELVNTYKDGKSSERVWNLIKKMAR